MSEFQWPVRVYYDDTDAGGIVYHAHYLRMMEHARTEWLRSLGFEQDVLLERHRRQFAVTSMSIDFVSPARFNDRLAVSVQVVASGGASLTFAQEVRRDETALCRARVRAACIDSDTMLPARMPDTLRAELANAS